MSLPLPGLHASFGYRIPFEQRMAMLREAGFTTTALWWEERRPEIRAMRDQAPAMVRAAGLELDNLHVPYFACNDLWSDSAVRADDARALHERWVDDCRRHGVRRMVMHVTLGTEYVPPASTHAVNTFRRLVEHAEARGVTLAVENTHMAGHVAFLLDHIDAPGLGLCFDAAHDALYSDTPLDLLCRYRDRLEVLHLSDIYRRRDAHLVPGDGRLDFAAVRALLPCPDDRPFSTVLESVGRPRKESVAQHLERACRSATQWCTAPDTALNADLRGAALGSCASAIEA